MNTQDKLQEEKELTEKKLNDLEIEIHSLEEQIKDQRRTLSSKDKTSANNSPEPLSSNYYHRLGIPNSASQEDIRKAYKQCTIAFHPDRNNNPNANVQFRNIKEAYDNLSDEIKRKQYDDSIKNIDYAAINKEMILNIGKVEVARKKRRELEIQLQKLNKDIEENKPQINGFGYLSNVTFAEKELKEFNGMKGDDNWMLRNAKGNVFTVTDKAIIGQGSDDATLNNIIDIYLACEKSKYAAAGRLSEFNPAKLNPTAKGANQTRLIELCRQRGIGTAINHEKHKENIKTSNKQVASNDNHIVPFRMAQ